MRNRRVALIVVWWRLNAKQKCQRFASLFNTIVRFINALDSFLKNVIIELLSHAIWSEGGDKIEKKGG
jgi:hypothetical protein